MNCEECREHLPAVSDGGGSAEARSHVDGCAACEKEVRLHRETWRLMLVLPSAKPSPGFLRGVREKVNGRASRILRFVAPFVAAAAAVLLVVFSLLGGPSGPVDPVASVEKEIQQLPEAERTLFRDLTADSETWDLAENLEDMRAVDFVGADKLGQEQYLLGEKK